MLRDGTSENVLRVGEGGDNNMPGQNFFLNSACQALAFYTIPTMLVSGCRLSTLCMQGKQSCFIFCKAVRLFAALRWSGVDHDY